MAAGGTEAKGGAIYGAGVIIGNGNEFLENEAKGSVAEGGAVYAGNITQFAGGYFQKNKATGDATGTGRGGAIYGADSVTANTVDILENEAAGDIAQGGAIYGAGNVSLTDTNLVNNKATGTTTSEGGAIYMSTDAATGGHLTLASTAGKVVTVSGNKAGTDANAIHFGGAGASNGILDIDSAGRIDLLDPVTVDMTAAGTFTLNKTGTGSLYWHGMNVFDAMGGTKLNLDAGTTKLSREFTAVGGTSGDYEVNLGGTFGFDGTRDNSIAMFDFSQTVLGGKTGLFTVDVGTVIDIDLSTELVSGDFSYLVADQYLAAFADQYLTSANFDSVFTKNGTADQIWLNTHYTSIYQSLINAADPNTTSSINAGALPDIFRDLTDEERRLLTSSTHYFDSSTPGWLLNQMVVGRSILTTGVETALRYGLGKGVIYHPDSVESDSGLAFVAPAGYHAGPRFWAGYMGDFDRLDSSDGYHGYSSDRHGVIFGMNYDFGMANSIGIYGGYTSSTTKGKGVAAKIETDVGHVGVIGRLSPFKSLPRLTVLADAGYTFGDSDSTRSAGSLTTTGEFDQKYYTAGLEVEYAARFGSASVTPFASLRYIHLKQDSFEESGALASHMDSVDDSACTSRVGASFGYDIPFKGNFITPTLNVAWRHEFGDRQYSANTFYSMAPTPVTYRVKSTQFDRDSVDIGAAIRANMNLDDKKMGLNVGYNLNAGSNRKNHSVYVGFDLSF